ncbi:MAG: Rrf2 family transcriptional regulator, partial [Lacticaseibacillus rhamnosus]
TNVLNRAEDAMVQVLKQTSIADLAEAAEA